MYCQFTWSVLCPILFPRPDQVGLGGKQVSTQYQGFQGETYLALALVNQKCIVDNCRVGGRVCALKSLVVNYFESEEEPLCSKRHTLWLHFEHTKEPCSVQTVIFLY